MIMCHLESARFYNAATSWGCDHELYDGSKYACFSSRTHQENLDVTSECVSSEYPFIAASADGLISWSLLR